jgi:hypothetical protein
MNSQTDALNKSIARCKMALPLPELWKKLGLRGEPNNPVSHRFGKRRIHRSVLSKKTACGFGRTLQQG